MKLSIIIPLYNEQELISQVLNELLKVNYPAFLSDYEIIVVDDCSKDASFSRVEEFAKLQPRVHLFRHEQNMGKGAAVRTGAGKASGDILLIQDADLELTPRDIPWSLIHISEPTRPY